MQTIISPIIESTWLEVLNDEFQKDYFKTLKLKLQHELTSGKKIFPEAKNIFAAFNHTPFPQVKVVILGQDPYHGIGQAQGLSFSVPKGVPLPPSLQNIFKEIKNEGYYNKLPLNGDLTAWAQQGVLLLNAILTVQAGMPASHSTIGWENFTDTVIQKISDNLNGVVFLLWGKFAQKKIKLIDIQKHYVLQAAHPSPFSAHNGFLGSKHFSKTNALLLQQGKLPINWEL